MAAELPAFPSLCDAVVTIKIGEPQTDCRIVHKGSIEISFSVREGYAVLKERLKRLFIEDPAVTWATDAAIYVKATVNARQHEYKRLPEDDQGFTGFLKAVWARFRRQGKRIPLFLYAGRVKRSNPIHRATASRIAQATRDINQLIQSEGREPPGPASIEYWATVQDRKPDGALIAQPNNETFRQLNYIDTQAQRHREEISITTAAATRATRCVHIRINGVLVPVDIDIQEFRQVLGLPGYDLQPPFRERVIPQTNEPNDMQGADHEEDIHGGDTGTNSEDEAEEKKEDEAEDEAVV